MSLDIAFSFVTISIRHNSAAQRTAQSFSVVFVRSSISIFICFSLVRFSGPIGFLNDEIFRFLSVPFR
jgi:hypothetical protein